jgi:two-component SAPR family response regulator
MATDKRGVSALLLQRRGETISKDELIKALWPDCVVEEIRLGSQHLDPAQSVGGRG